MLKLKNSVNLVPDFENHTEIMAKFNGIDLDWQSGR